MKKCRKCGVYKSLDLFSKRKIGKDGLDTICKNCKAEYDRSYYHTNTTGQKLTRKLELNKNRRQRIKESKPKVLKEKKLTRRKYNYNSNRKSNVEANKRKAELLGMPFGTACGRLRKSLMYHLVKKLGLDECFRCQAVISSLEEFSIDHVISWQTSSDPYKNFFDVENIRFSHHKCNVAAGSGFKIKK